MSPVQILPNYFQKNSKSRAIDGLHHCTATRRLRERGQHRAAINEIFQILCGLNHTARREPVVTWSRRVVRTEENHYDVFDLKLQIVDRTKSSTVLQATV